MNIGIFTYGTRGDVQPCIALALGLKARGHEVSLAAPENFKSLAEQYGVKFLPLCGDAEAAMNGPEGQKVLQTGNTIKLMKFFFAALEAIKHPLRQSYLDAAAQVDFILANSATLPITSAIADKYHKPLAVFYFMPPVVPTDEFPISGLDFINLKGYNKLSYKLAHSFFWRFVKRSVNEFREELGLMPLKENLITHIGRQKPLDLYCISPSLIPQPGDWEPNSKITGFATMTEVYANTNQTDANTALDDWLLSGPAPVYMGFGSNGVGSHIKMGGILTHILSKTNERILFCTGWSQYSGLPLHANLFITKYVNHDAVFPQCKAGIFHGGAGTLAAMLRNKLPVVIVSFYTDQPTWGKIVAQKKLGVHITAKKLSAARLIEAMEKVRSAEIGQNVTEISKKLSQENGVAHAVDEIEKYFGSALN